jgi:hypothetical protein
MVRGLNKSEVFKAFASISSDSSLLYLKLDGVESEISQLRSSIAATNKGFQRLFSRRIFLSKGWLKFVEVTAEGEKVRPVIHCLSIVKPSWLTSKYVKKASWTEAWQDCMRTTQTLSVAMKIAKKAGAEMPLSFQESQGTSDLLWFAELSEQVYHLKSFTAGGIVRAHLHSIQRRKQ